MRLAQLLFPAGAGMQHIVALAQDVQDAICAANSTPRHGGHYSVGSGYRGWGQTGRRDSATSEVAHRRSISEVDSVVPRKRKCVRKLLILGCFEHMTLIERSGQELSGEQ